MTITTEELDRIRAAAVGDMLGDSKALDEMGPAATIFRLCQEIKRLEQEADWLIVEKIVYRLNNGKFIGAPNVTKDGYVVYPTKSEAVISWREAAHRAVEEER